MHFSHSVNSVERELGNITMYGCECILSPSPFTALTAVCNL